MKKQIILLAVALLFLVSSVSAFNLTEVIPLRADHREEGRIDNNWLLNEGAFGTLTGYIVITEGQDGGQMDVYYGGFNLAYEKQHATSSFKIKDVWTGPYGYHYRGFTDKLELVDRYGQTKCVVSEVEGFYNPETNQVYVHFTNKDIGMTWVSYINEWNILMQPTKGNNLY